MPVRLRAPEEVDEIRDVGCAQSRRAAAGVGKAFESTRDVEEDADDVVVLSVHGHECRLRGAGVVGADREGRARPDELAVRLLVQAPADEDRAARHEREIGLRVVELVEASDGADTEPVLGRRPGGGGGGPGGGGGHPAVAAAAARRAEVEVAARRAAGEAGSWSALTTTSSPRLAFRTRPRPGLQCSGSGRGGGS